MAISPSLPLLITISFLSLVASAAPPTELLKGFEATPDPSSTTAFQPLLVDPSGNFSLCFLRSPLPDLLSLAVVHLPSLEPLWTAPLNRPARWDKRTRFTFNGSLVIYNSRSGAFWSTNTSNGNRAALSPSSNLQIFGSGSGSEPLWQSFQFPSNTLVESQNFTSAMTLASSNGLYTLRLGADFIGLYAEFNPGKPEQMYYRRTAIQAKATIVPGHGPICMRVDPSGYLGLFQTGPKPADVQPFSSHLRPIPGIRIIRIEQDGNLKAYYWSGSEFVLDFQSISETCDLPSPCGAYGLCRAGSGCSCLYNSTDARPGECNSGRVTGDFCGNEGFSVLRKVGVELPYKDLMAYTETPTFERCEGECAANCTCWAAVYSNTSGRCYTLDYAVRALVAVGDSGKMGYFKVRAGAGKARVSPRLGAGIGLLCGALVLLIVAVGFGGYRLWKRRKSVKYLEQEEMVAPGPYKNLGSDSFGSIELSNR